MPTEPTGNDGRAACSLCGAVRSTDWMTPAGDPGDPGGRRWTCDRPSVKWRRESDDDFSARQHVFDRDHARESGTGGQ
jgi:hypothetical protein